MIDVSAKKSRKSCIGHWDSEGPLVKILEKPVETITRTSGTARSGVVYLQPEEWVLFVERGTLVIQKQNAGLEQTTEDLADVWVRALDRSGFSLDEYRAYSYLRRLGYVVVCPKHEVAAENSSRMDCSLEETKANDVYNDLLNHAPRNAILGATGNSLFSGGYGVYKPEHPFKKRDPGQPQYRLVIVSAQSRAPATDELLEMAHSDSAISTVFGVSEPGVAGFLKVLPSVVPKAPHRQRQRQDETPK
ncbi:hypothetical protein LPJ64_003924 [Coemansia asiatica]|uniref:tRNA-splicing endonuclease subunit Sen54 N-terminal domain-containing protein n=1 Tax=Coemansia asiatica TaxID=1052880 RepID=A0A9W7XK60_9FUNG|nr:hypothetical protein LPJ64_003924 [Coemansia asiatica]